MCSQALSLGRVLKCLGVFKWFSSCRFPRLVQSRMLLFPCPQSREGKKRKENKGNTRTVWSGRGDRVLGFLRLDWRGFGPLNRSTCSSGISRKQELYFCSVGMFAHHALGPNGCLSEKLRFSFRVVACKEVAVWLDTRILLVQMPGPAGGSSFVPQ